MVYGKRYPNQNEPNTLIDGKPAACLDLRLNLNRTSLEGSQHYQTKRAWGGLVRDC